MYLVGFSLNNLSLMALTIATGFVVDDAIVVLENVTRHLEMGKSRVRAAIDGAGEVGFTVLSITLSLIAVFAPLIFFGGIVGRLFSEFALTLSIAVVISLVVSLTMTPMMCALVLPRETAISHGRLYNAVERVFDGMLAFYRRTLLVALDHPGATAMTLLATIGLNYYLFRYQVTYGLFPAQDTGLIIGAIQGDQSISFQAMRKKLEQLQGIVQADPAVASIVGFTGGRQTNSGFVYVSLKPYGDRAISADEVVSRLRGKLTEVAGARLFMFPVSDLRAGGRPSNAAYQYTLLSDDTAQLYEWTPKLVAALANSDVIKDVNTDQEQSGLQTNVTIDRDNAMRLGLTLSAIDNTLYDAFGQRQVSTIYNAMNQYHVVMEVEPRYWQDPIMLSQLYVSTSGANPTGTQQTGISAGLFSSNRIRFDRRFRRRGFGAKSRDQRHRRQWTLVRFGRIGRLDFDRDHGAFVRFREIFARSYAHQRESSGPLRRFDGLVQRCARPGAERSEDRDRQRHRADRHALDRVWRFRRHGGAIHTVAV